MGGRGGLAGRLAVAPPSSCGGWVRAEPGGERWEARSIPSFSSQVLEWLASRRRQPPRWTRVQSSKKSPMSVFLMFVFFIVNKMNCFFFWFFFMKIKI